MTTVSEHLTWAKDRALEHVSRGELRQAFLSMMSDLRKHPETERHPMIELGAQLFTGGHLDSSIQMRKFIEGF
jgi:hypothetical protein